MAGERHRGWVASIHLFVRKRSIFAQHCELCGTEIPPDHSHLAALTSRQVLCCCSACAVFLSNRDHPKYRRVPKCSQPLEDFHMTDAQWDSLLIPVDIAFFFRSSADGRMVGLYPSPAGVIESLLDLTAWDELVVCNPVLAEFEPDVEALLVNRVGGAREHFRVPIDQCYGLAGLVRTTWRGFGGGDVPEAVRGFFARLKENASGGGSPP